jgi:CO/xanthine dehydrogenase FAD-binding subunit
VGACAAERLLLGERPDGGAAHAAAAAAIAGRSAYGDIRATAQYRLSLLEILTQRAVEQAGKEAIDGQA